MQVYKSLIDKDLQFVNAHLPENSLEKSHIKSVLISSIESNYQEDVMPFNILEIQSLIVNIDTEINNTERRMRNFHRLEFLRKLLSKLENVQMKILNET